MKFCLLPPEIQLRIWSLAARTEEPEKYNFVSMRNDRRMRTAVGPRTGSSRIRRHPKTIPIVLHICRDSRAVAQSIFKVLPLHSHSRRQDLYHYFNVLYDDFYIGGDSWDQFKILIDILITRNTTRPLLTGIQKDLGLLLNIRRLMVDLNIFGAVPVGI
jgi:hypothetical protein